MTDNNNKGAHAAGQVYPPGDPVPLEPLDPLMLAEVLEALALRQAALERAFDALHRRLGTTPTDGPWAWAALCASGRPSTARASSAQAADMVSAKALKPRIA